MGNVAVGESTRCVASANEVTVAEPFLYVMVGFPLLDFIASFKARIESEDELIMMDSDGRGEDSEREGRGSALNSARRVGVRV